LKVILVNLLAALNRANVFFKIKKLLKNEKNVKNVKKTFFTSVGQMFGNQHASPFAST